MISTFIMLTQDNWDSNMKNLMVLTDSTWLPALFTIVTMVIGIYSVLNLFLAILLNNLEQVRLYNGQWPGLLLPTRAPISVRSVRVSTGCKRAGCCFPS